MGVGLSEVGARVMIRKVMTGVTVGGSVQVGRKGAVTGGGVAVGGGGGVLEGSGPAAAAAAGREAGRAVGGRGEGATRCSPTGRGAVAVGEGPRVYS